jgi:hypothetical protein
LPSCAILFWTSFWVAQISSTLFTEWTETATVARGCDCMFAISINCGRGKSDTKADSRHSVHSQGHNLPADVATGFPFCAWSRFHTNLWILAVAEGQTWSQHSNLLSCDSRGKCTSGRHYLECPSNESLPGSRCGLG